MLLIPTLLCPKPWESMAGDESARFCTYCKKHVHNLAALSVPERLALLKSPAASICSRYRVAVRRPVRGQEASYARHLAKYGAAVALTGSVLVVLWEMEGRAEQEKFYRLAGEGGRVSCEMPTGWYREHQVVLLGDIALPEEKRGSPTTDDPAQASPPPEIDLKLDPAEMERLIAQEEEASAATVLGTRTTRDEVGRAVRNP